MPRSMQPAIVSVISALVGQMSLRYTALPSPPKPIGVVTRSSITVPLSAYATTSGGLARKLARTSGDTRPSKLRLPEITEAATMLLLLIATLIGSSTGHELPMQVVQP